MGKISAKTVLNSLVDKNETRLILWDGDEMVGDSIIDLEKRHTGRNQGYYDKRTGMRILVGSVIPVRFEMGDYPESNVLNVDLAYLDSKGFRRWVLGRGLTCHL
jgi:hypothetical protein